MVDQDVTVQNVDVETKRLPFDWKKTLILLAGMAVFLAIYFSPPWPVAVDPTGKEFALSPEGKAALSRAFQATTAFIDSTGHCLFIAFPILDPSPADSKEWSRNVTQFWVPNGRQMTRPRSAQKF